MSDYSKFCVDEDQSILSAIAQIQKSSCRCVLVRNAERKITAVLSEGDILRAILNGTDLHAPLANAANPSFKYLQGADASIQETIPLFKQGITIVPILDNKFDLLQVITIFDLLEQQL